MVARAGQVAESGRPSREPQSPQESRRERDPGAGGARPRQGGGRRTGCERQNSATLPSRPREVRPSHHLHFSPVGPCGCFSYRPQDITLSSHSVCRHSTAATGTTPPRWPPRSAAQHSRVCLGTFRSRFPSSCEGFPPDSSLGHWGSSSLAWPPGSPRHPPSRHHRSPVLPTAVSLGELRAHNWVDQTTAFVGLPGVW